MKIRKNLFTYSIIEALAVSINYTVYFMLCHYDINYLDANAAAWIPASVFTYLFSRRTALHIKNNQQKEIIAFGSQRFAALLIETFLLLIAVDCLKLSSIGAKIVISIVSVLKNYTAWRKQVLTREPECE